VAEYPVLQERTSYRDLSFLRRHRDWGWNCPGEDIDFIEYDHKLAVALLEYKMTYDLQNCIIPQESSKGYANLAALIDVGNKASLPVFVVFYKHKWNFRIFPLNHYANSKQPPSHILSELQFVQFLYQLRGRDLPEEIKAKLKSDIL